MELGLIESVLSLGLGAVIAVILILIKRQDDKEHAAELDRIHKEHAAEIVRITNERQQFTQQTLARLYEVADKLTEALNGVRNGLDQNTAAIGGMANLAEMAELLRKFTNEQRRP